MEGDLRKPRVSKYLGLIGNVGVSSVLSGRKQNSTHVLQRTNLGGLVVLASGPIPPNPSELLGTDHARQTLAELRARYEYVIIDAPPLLPVTDAAVLAAMADGALVIARHATTKRDQLARAVGNLHSVGARILGTVITMTPTNGRGGYDYKVLLRVGSVDTPDADDAGGTRCRPHRTALRVAEVQRCINPGVRGQN